MDAAPLENSHTFFGVSMRRTTNYTRGRNIERHLRKLYDCVRDALNEICLDMSMRTNCLLSQVVDPDHLGHPGMCDAQPL
eukprot:8521823-Pyramimonas_sp.AAC.1